MGEAVPDHSVDARIRQHDLDPAAGGRIAGGDAADVVRDLAPQAH
jgi:hypothetical protein